MNHQDHQSCFDACVRCAQECEHCATSCLAEADVPMLVECIRLDRDCAMLCTTAAALMCRDSDYLNDICRVCADACDDCAAECASHEHDHCQRCAEECRRCADECRQMAAAVPTGV